MNRIGVLLTVALVILFAVFIGIWKFSGNALPDFSYPEEKLVQIYMVDKNGKSVTLKKNDQDQWIVNDQYPANDELLGRLLQDINTQKNIGRVPQSQRKAIKKSIQAQYVKVELYNKDEKVKVFYVGPGDESYRGNYMTMEGISEIYDVQVDGENRNMSYDYVVEENDWRSIWLMDEPESNIQSVELTYVDSPQLSYIVYNEPPSYKLLNQGIQTTEGINTAKTAEYFRMFEDLPFVSVANQNKEREQIIKSSNKIGDLKVTLKKGGMRVFELYWFPQTRRSKNLNGEPDPKLHDPDYLFVYTPKDDELYAAGWLSFGRVIRKYPEFFQR